MRIFGRITTWVASALATTPTTHAGPVFTPPAQLQHQAGTPRDDQLKGWDNNTWFHYQESSDTVVVFIHGLLSNSDSCWRNEATKAYWPDLLRSDSHFAHANIFLGGYHTATNSEKYDIAQCAREFFAALNTSFQSRTSPIQHKNILFIAHSLGGIVCRRVIEENYRSFKAKTIGLVLMASPSMGSKWAKNFAALGRAYGHSIAAELLPESSTLRDIDDRFRQLLYERRLDCIVGAEAVEQSGLGRWKLIPTFTSRIVDGSSASRYFGAERQIPDTNHFTIVKPSSAASQSHLFLMQFYQQKFSTVEQRTSSTQVKRSHSVKRGPVGDPLFEIYHEASAAFYADRDFDATFRERAAYTSVWLSGPSGVGKTSIVRRYIHLSGMRPIEVSLSHLATSCTRKDLLNEINETVRSAEAAAQSSDLFQNIGTVCRNSNLAVFLDEVPLNAESLDIVQAIGSVLDGMKRKGFPECRFVACSIREPDPAAINGRMREQFSFHSLPPWSGSELQSLLATIRSAGLQVPSEYDARLIAEANGSPRFIKGFLRIAKARQAVAGSVNFDMIVEEVRKH